MPQPHNPADAAEQRSMPLQTRLMPVGTIDAASRTFECVFTTGVQVKRFDWMTWQYYLEELSLDPSAVRMDRMQNGAPLLDSHQQCELESVLGVIERAWIADGEGRCIARMSERDDEVKAIWSDVAAGIIRNVSVGYIVHRYEKTDPPTEGGLPVWKAIDWEPAEVSLVAVPADAMSGVRALPGERPDPARALADIARQVGNRTFPCEISARRPLPASASVPPAAATAVSATSRKESPMDEPVQTQGAAASSASGATAAPSAEQVRAEERTRISSIRHAVALAVRATPGLRLAEGFEQGLIDRGASLDEARSAIFAALEQHSTSAGPSRSAAAIQTTVDEQEQRRADMSAAMAHRAAPGSAQLPETARRYRGYSLFELARRSLEEQGLKTEGMSRNEVVSIAMGNSDAMGFRALHHTSDFAVALASTINRSLRAGYQGSPRTFTQWCRPGTLADFRPATRVAMAGALALEKVNQNGEFKRGKLVDAGEQIQLATWGKVVGVSRQVIINDDLDFLSRLPQMYARAAADFESDTVYGILTGNPNMSDGTTLFHANHGNLAASGTVIAEAGLSAARTAMRLQKDPANPTQPLNLTGKYIIVPAAKETEAQKNFQAVVVAAKAADTNVFNQLYEIVVEPRLDASSATAWYLAADPSQIDTIEYAYLEGEQGLYTEQRMGFDVDGLEVKARLDFAAKAIDWRGLYRNPGA